MKIKKYVSKILISGILINNFSILSGASSFDTRYESFEGDYLTVDDVFESDKIDLEIEGNTLINYMDYSTMTTGKDGAIINKDTREISFGNNILENDSSYTDMNLFCRPNLKHGKTYTLIVNVLENTLKGNQFFAILDNWQNYISNESARLPHGRVGIVKFKFTVKESHSGIFKMYLRNYKDQDDRGVVKLKDLMILEGDWTDKEAPPYFEGMKSVGEKGNVNEIELIANNRNLFDIDSATNRFISPEGTTLFNADHGNKTSDFIKIEPNSFYLYNVENFTNTNGLWTGYAFYREKDMNSVIGNRVVINSLKDVVIKAPEDAKYIRIGSRYLQQEGVKVYFQKLNSNYISDNKNLFDINNAINQFITIGGTALSNADYGNKTSDFIKVEPNTLYLYNVENFTNTNGLWTGYGFYKEKDMNSIIDDRVVIHSLNDVIIKTPENAKYLRIGSRYLQQEGVKVELKKIAELSNFKCEEFAQDIKNIVLNEPLRGLSSGVRDRIIKRNGQWVIERNLKEVILDGSENWYAHNDYDGTDVRFFYLKSNDACIDSTTINSISDKFNAYSTKERRSNQSKNIEGIYVGDNVQGLIQVHILKSKLSSEDSNGFKLYLKNNPVKVVYKLENPIYEPLKVDLPLQLFEGTTYISNNSVIPANLKTTIDRIINISIEAIKEAIKTPTLYNMSQARMWVNQMSDSRFKDEMQARLNEILDIDDMQLEKKSVTSNVDVYIESENTLSMSLDTNFIIFDNYSGVEDVEKINALNITVSSSLPYQLNAYLSSEIQNSDKSNSIDSNILNIKESSESNYQAFIDNVTKILLKDNCSNGNNISHGIDIRLNGNLAHKADVYKTVIKFEAEQK